MTKVDRVRMSSGDVCIKCLTGFSARLHSELPLKDIEILKWRLYQSPFVTKCSHLCIFGPTKIKFVTTGRLTYRNTDMASFFIFGFKTGSNLVTILKVFQSLLTKGRT